MLKKIFCIIEIIALCIGMAAPVQAKPRTQAELQDRISMVTELLKEVLRDKYKNTVESFKADIVANDYDYDLSMESFSQKGNPYKDIDYLGLLAAYMSCKTYAEAEGLRTVPLSEIPFVKYSFTEEGMEDYKPAKYMTYSLYTPNGYEKEIPPDGQVYVEFAYEYATSPTEVDEYVRYAEGSQFFVKTGRKVQVNPEPSTIRYADAEFSVITAEDMYGIFGIDKGKVSKDCERRLEKLKDITTTKQIVETVFAELPSDQNPPVKISGGDIPVERKKLIETALSLVGRVPYEWGGKARMPGYDPRWWSFSEDSNTQHGLDCSGYVQWAYITAGYPERVCKGLYSTSHILSAGYKKILKSELIPGDIGVLNDGSKLNHTGIYLGNDQWIHCSSKKATVAVSEFHFTIFFSPLRTEYPEEDEAAPEEQPQEGQLEQEPQPVPVPVPIPDPQPEETPEPIQETAEPPAPVPETAGPAQEIPAENTAEEAPVTETDIIKSDTVSNNLDTSQLSLYYNNSFTQADIYLVAQLISHEAKSEGLNGWIAVGEVVKNRLYSPDFPNTVSGVVYQKGQFANSSSLSKITPSAEILTVAQKSLTGEMQILCSPEVVFFRNPRITSGISPTAQVNWGSHRWYAAVGNHAFYIK